MQEVEDEGHDILSRVSLNGTNDFSMGRNISEIDRAK